MLYSFRRLLKLLYHSLYLYPYYLIRGDKGIANLRHNKIMGKDINWDNPRDFNEKINWLKINTDTSIWSLLADKYRVREYIESKGYGHILVPLYGKWNNANDIDFESLPNSFVLKTNHGCGEIILVKDKSKIDFESVKQCMQKYIKTPYGVFEGEPHYRKIPPCIIAEEYLMMPPDSYTTSLVDYKIFCFNGEPKYIWCCYSRTKEHTYVEVHDTKWNYYPEKSVFTDHYRDGKGIVPKPKSLTQMLEIASNLSVGFPELRVDLYEYNNRIYFGELTFSSAGGYNYFFTQDFLNELGDYCTLPIFTK